MGLHLDTTDQVVDSGTISIRGGRFVADYGFVFSGGNIDISATNDIEILNGSGIYQFAGDLLKISSGASINISGDSSTVYSLSMGNIDISATNDINILDGGGVYQVGGDLLNISAGRDINISGGDSSNPFLRSGIYSRGVKDEAAGDICISANSLNILDGGKISGSTFSEGRSADITITASESVNISGGSGGNYSMIDAQAQGSGDAGSITVTTPLLRLGQGGVIAGESAEEATGSGADINLNVEKLELINGGRVDSSTLGVGAEEILISPRPAPSIFQVLYGREITQSTAVFRASPEAPELLETSTSLLRLLLYGTV